MKILYAEGRSIQPGLAAKIVEVVDGVSLKSVASLTQVYHIAEHTTPEVVLVDCELTSVPEFSIIEYLCEKIGATLGVVMDAEFSQFDLPNIVNLRKISQTASREEIREFFQLVGTSGGAACSKDPKLQRKAPDRTDHFKKNAVILIGSSTGGVDALIEVLQAFPRNCPPTFIVQHIGEAFGGGLVDLLRSRTSAHVIEATEGLDVGSGQIVVAAGGARHLTVVQRQKGQFLVRLRDGSAVSGHRPSVDVLFKSAVDYAPDTANAILTGMGRDGSDGLLALRQAGAQTFGQDEATSMVYGMPKAAFQLGAVQQQLPLDRIGEALLSACRKVG